MVYYLGEELIETSAYEAASSKKGAVFIINEEECAATLASLGILF